MRLRLSLLPREEKFFFLLHQSATNIQKATRKLKDLMDQYENVAAKVQEIKELENFGDQIIHDLIQSLHRTFVTPIDREDIASLAERLDDVLDAVEEAARYLVEYQIAETTPYAAQLADVLCRCADQLEKATAMLHHRGARLRQILPITVEINRLENEGDQIVSKAMGELFAKANDALHIMKWRDIYNDLEGAADRAEDAANILEGIVLKHA